METRRGPGLAARPCRPWRMGYAVRTAPWMSLRGLSPGKNARLDGKTSNGVFFCATIVRIVA